MINQQAIALLAGAFPMFREAQMQTYGAMLNDIPPEIQFQAVKNVIKTAKFLPTIAEIREEAIRIARGSMNVTKNIPEQEWEIVYRAIGAVGPYRKPRFGNTVTALTVKAMGWQGMCSAEEKMIPTLRSQFIKTWNMISSKERAKRRTTRTLGENKVKNITGNVLKSLEGGKQ